MRLVHFEGFNSKFCGKLQIFKICMKLDWRHGIFEKKIPVSLRVWLYLRVVTLWTISRVGRNDLTFNDIKWFIKKVLQIIFIIINNLNHILKIGIRTLHLSCLSLEKVHVSIYMSIYLLHPTKESMHLKTWRSIL